MKLNADIIYDNLIQHFVVKTIGSNIKELVLSRPVFLHSNTEYANNRIYIGRSGQLPIPPRGITCLIVCVGGGLPSEWDTRQCCTFVISEESDLLRVFNILTEIFDRYDRWSDQLHEIFEKNASIAEMIGVTVPVLRNPICLCNNKLEVEAEVGIEDYVSNLGPVAEEYYNEFRNSHADNIARREPFLFHIRGMSVYCINIYKQDTYLGLITCGAQNHPLTAGDQFLLRYFFEFVKKAAEKRSNVISRQFVTVKSVVHDLLNCLPVNTDIVKRALKKEYHSENGLIDWLCAAILPIYESGIPSEYYCMLLESRLSGCFALYLEPYIALYLPTMDNQEDICYKSLESVLSKMSMHAGISYRFNDIMNARYYFRQAVNALETGIFCGGNETLYSFNNHSLSYVLKNSMGELPLECIIPECLLQLRPTDEQAGRVDYWNTLKVYLDNEMNATQTARDLYIHRTTLQVRLDKIHEAVQLDTPEQRLFIRYCMYLYELINKEESDKRVKTAILE